MLRENILVGRRVLGEGDDLTLSMRANYALALHVDDSATIDDLREAVTILEETERTDGRDPSVLRQMLTCANFGNFVIGYFSGLKKPALSV